MTYSIIKKSQLESTTRLDAEYYQPEILELVSKIKAFSNGFESVKESGASVVSGPFGSSLKSDAYLSSGVPFLRISDLENFFIENSDLVYISKEDNARLKQSQLFPFDLVLSKVGNTIGIVSAVPEEFKVCNISENNIGIKFKDPKTASDKKTFILVFLNSKLGFSQIMRSISGNAQPKLNVQDVYDLIYPIPSEEFSKSIENIVVEAKKKLDQCNTLYQQAEKMLLEALGMGDYQFDSELSSVVSFTDLKSAERIDAEYFQPKYAKLEKKIKEHNAQRLGDLVTVKKGFEPGAEAYLEEGKLFIRVSSLTKLGIIDKDQKYLSENLYKELKKDYEPKVGEILLTKDASPGTAYVVKESIEGIISGGIVRLKLKEQNIEPEYLALCISSIVGQAQAQRDAGGSVIMHWKPEQIKNLLVPVLPQNAQKKISELVILSHEARKKAKELLEEAKRKVEELIERGDG